MFRRHGRLSHCYLCIPSISLLLSDSLIPREATAEMSEDKAVQLQPVIAFRAPPDLHAWADEAAAAEGISRSDIARRALLRDRQRQQQAKGATA
jgi:hypothetical protein